MQLTAEARWEQSTAATGDCNGSTNRQPDRCDVYPLPSTCGRCHTERAKRLGRVWRGTNRCDDGVDKTAEWGAALEAWAKAHKLKAERLPRENKKNREGTGTDFSVSPVCYRHTLFRLIICLRATGYIYLDGGDKERSSWKLSLTTSGQKSFGCHCEEKVKKEGE